MGDLQNQRLPRNDCQGMMQTLKVRVGNNITEALWHRSQSGEWQCLNAWKEIKWMEGMTDPKAAKAELRRRNLEWFWDKISRH